MGNPTLRLDIEGLRGVAVLAVVLFHAFPLWVPGGFVGVDIFFVISGYVITRSLCQEIERTGGRIDLLGFWARRARRLLPTSTLVLLATVLLTFHYIPFNDLSAAARDLRAASLFILNWRLADKSIDYGASETASVVQHYWSLGVEEQFYIVWPVVILGCLLLCRRSALANWQGLLLKVVAAIGVLSFAAMIWQIHVNQPFAFFGSHARAWQLALGASIALLPAHRLLVGAGVRTVLACAGAAAIATSIALFAIEIDYPGWKALLPTLGTGLVIFAGHGANPVATLLSGGALTFAGRISYAWYLWHWPALFFGALAFPGHGPAILLALIGLSFALAVVTHFAIENPIRFSTGLQKRAVVSLALGAVLVAVNVAEARRLLKYPQHATIELADGTRIKAQRHGDDLQPDKKKCFMDPEAVAYDGCVFGKVGAEKRVVLFGDSHAYQWFPAINEAAKRARVELIVRTKGSCSVVDALLWHPATNTPYTQCRRWQSLVEQELQRLRPDLIIVGSASEWRLSKPDGSGPDDALTRQGRAEVEHAILARLSASTSALVVLRDSPWLPESPIDCLLRHPRNEGVCHWPYEEVRHSTAYPLADDLPSNATVLDLSEKLCPNGTCRAFESGHVVMGDRSHLRPHFAVTLASEFEHLFKTNVALETAR